MGSDRKALFGNEGIDAFATAKSGRMSTALHALLALPSSSLQVHSGGKDGVGETASLGALRDSKTTVYGEYYGTFETAVAGLLHNGHFDHVIYHPPHVSCFFTRSCDFRALTPGRGA